MTKSKSATRLTSQTLQDLKRKGFRFVLVKGYTLDKRLDYIQMNHFTLVPVMELPAEPGAKEIYEPIDSDILQEWADSPDRGLIAYIEQAHP